MENHVATDAQDGTEHQEKPIDHRKLPRGQKIPRTGVGTGEIAWLLGASGATVSGWLRNGILHYSAPGLIDPAEAVRDWAAYQFRNTPSPRKTIEEQKALKIERENKLANRELVPLTRHREIIHHMVQVFRVWVRALPGRISSTASMSEPAVLREAVRVECSSVLEQLASAAGMDVVDSAVPVLDPEDQSPDPLPGHLGRANPSPAPE